MLSLENGAVPATPRDHREPRARHRAYSGKPGRIIRQGPTPSFLRHNPRPQNTSHSDLRGTVIPLHILPNSTSTLCFFLLYPSMHYLKYIEFYNQAEIGRHVVGDREWEVYRIHLGEDHELSAPPSKIVQEVTKMLMGWE